MDLLSANLRLSLIRSYWQQADLDWAYPSYQRPYNWLIYTESGRGVVSADGRDYPLEAGHAIVVPLNSLCHYRCIEPMRIAACAFTLQVAQGVDAFDVFHAPQQPQSVTQPQLLETIITSGADNAGTLAAMGAMYQLLAPILGQANSLSAEGQTDYPRLQRVIRYIDDNLSEPLSVGQLAALNGHSEGHFSRWFSRLMGTSAKRFIVNKRIEQATKLLLFSSQNIDAIARQCGYQDALYFSRIFKRHIGLPPTEYRKIKSGL